MNNTDILQILPENRVGLVVRNLTVRVAGKAFKKADIETSTAAATDGSGKTILDDVSFDLASGQMLAIMGGSGSGKTTLLNTLSQRVNVNNKTLNFSGVVNYTRASSSFNETEINSKKTSQKSMIKHAYLLQDDVFLPGLTVFETLQTQADLRLPPHTTRHEKLSLITSLLTVLELLHLQDEIITSFSTHSTNLSGGEQRRVSMAIQLLSKPSILFLDEPTTGLDTSSSLKLIRVLKKLASPEFGITVVLSIHQPRPEISVLFDDLCLLTRGGRLVYYGNLVNIGGYFQSLKFLENDSSHIANPSSWIEYVIDLSIKDVTSREKELFTIDRIEKLVLSWKSHSNYPRLELTPQEFRSRFQQNLKYFARNDSERISFLTELTVLTKRTFLLTYRDKASLIALNFGSALMAVVVGWMFYKPDPDLAGIRSITSQLYVMIEVVGFAPMFFELERLWSVDGMFFYREYSENYVSVPGWLISRRLGKLFLEDLPVPLIFASISYFMWGLRMEDGDGNRDASYFGAYVAITILINFAGMTGAVLLFAVSSTFAVSVLVYNGLYQLQNSACGYFVNAAAMPVYVRWTKYISYFWYAFGALSANQFSGWMGNCPYDDVEQCAEYSGDYNLKTLGFPGGWVGEPIGILVAWWLGFYIFAGLALKFLRYDVSIGKEIKNRWEGQDGGEAEEEVQQEAFEDKQLVRTAGGTDGNDSDCNTYLVERSEVSPIQSKKKEFSPTSSVGDDIEVNIDSLSLNVVLKNLFGKKMGNKLLLNDINATFVSNKVNVIMGPSGSGKTTLLNYLSDRLPRSSSFTSVGNIKFNKGQIVSKEELAKVSSYVTQHDDSLIPKLTVRETFYYQAKLRLPHHVHKQIPQTVATLIRQMGLIDCADTPIGSEFVKGISGGEKRRVSIGVQLLSKPKILFLDEPTSGLDSTNAIKILKLLSDLSESNKTTIILTIHQPQQEMFYSFGSLLLLARGGSVVYNGTTRDLPGYLESIGHKTPGDVNIADHMLDLVSNKIDEEVSQSQERVDSMIRQWRDKDSVEGKENPFRHSSERTGSEIDLKKYEFKRSSILYTSLTVTKRQLLNATRSKDVIISRAGQTLFLAVVHTLYFAPLKNDKQGIDNRLGIIQDALNLYYAGLINNLTIYPIEKDIFYQEYKDDIYGVVEFSLSYLVNELPVEIIPCLIFSAMIVFAVGLPRTPGMFFGMFSTCFSCINCGESLGILVNSMFNHMGVATNILANVVILAIFMGGTMSLTMPPFFKVINYISPLKYGVGICAKLGFSGQKFTCGLEECTLSSGTAVLESYNLDIDLGSYFGGLFACLVLYRLIAIASVHVRVRYLN